MPITGNVAWDPRLELFKGKDSAQFVRTAASVAITCCRCRLPLAVGDALSVAVDVSVGPGPHGTDYRAFDCCVGHRGCCIPGVQVHERGSVPEELVSAGAVMVLHCKEGGRTRTVPALVFTLLPNLSFGVPGAEFTSLLVSVLLGKGFQLAPTADPGAIVEHAARVDPDTFCTVTPQGLLTLQVAGDPMHTRQLDPDHPDGSAWLKAAAGGQVLVLGGDNLSIASQGADLATAAEQGTLVAGWVPVRFERGHQNR